MKKIFTKRVVMVVLLAVIPGFVFADGSGAMLSTGFSSLSSLINSFVNTVVKSTATLFFSLALLAFFYGIVQFIWGMREGVEKKITEGKTFMQWSLGALFVMFSVYGIIQLGQGILFGGSSINTITIPDINFKTGGTSSYSNGLTNPVTTVNTNSNTNSGTVTNPVTTVNTNSGNNGGASKKADGQSCSSDNDCASGSGSCQSNICTKPGYSVDTNKSNGASCTNPGECLSGFCISGFCKDEPPAFTGSSGPQDESSCTDAGGTWDANAVPKCEIITDQ